MANVLPFSVTIGPNDEVTCEPSLVSEVFRYGLLVLWSIRVNTLTLEQYPPIRSKSYIMNRSYYRSTEQRFWRRRAPILVLRAEVNLSQMSSDTGHGDTAMAP